MAMATAAAAAAAIKQIPQFDQRSGSNRLRFSSIGIVSPRRCCCLAMSKAETGVEEKLGIKVERNPPESRLKELGVKSWPKWGCSPSKFPWTYEAQETCYLLEGKVRVYSEGSGNEFVDIQAGDMVVFPKGMSCTWDVTAAVDKHYKFD